MRCNKELPRRQYEQYGERRTTPLQPLENCSKALIIPTRPHCKSIRPACLLRPALQPERAGERNHRAIIRTKFNIRIKNLKSMRLRRLRKLSAQLPVCASACTDLETSTSTTASTKPRARSAFSRADNRRPARRIWVDTAVFNPLKL